MNELGHELAAISARIAQAHRDRPTMSAAYHRARSAAISSAISRGLNITAAKEHADAEVYLLREALDELDGELAASCEERDQLRFVIQFLT